MMKFQFIELHLALSLKCWVQNNLLTLTLNSLSGWGISRPLICVTMGPSVPAMTIWSLSRSFPFTRMTSIVVPKPWIAFTWKYRKRKSSNHSNIRSFIWFVVLCKEIDHPKETQPSIFSTKCKWPNASANWVSCGKGQNYSIMAVTIWIRLSF